jgi:trk system potassium uptake protein TrkA
MSDLPDGVVIGAITRGNTLIKPRGDTVVERGDHVVVFTEVGVLSEVTEKL